MHRARVTFFAATLAAVFVTATAGVAAGGPTAAEVVGDPLRSSDRSGSVSAAESGGFSSDNVEWVTVLPQHTGTAGGTLVGKFYYLTDPRGVFIYDVSEPTAPELVGELPAVQSTTHAVLAQEEPETNGKILLVNAVHPDAATGAPTSNGWLLVVDVKDKTSPKVVGALSVYDHTWSCVLNCKYAIGRTGDIIDLRDPTKPEVVADWREHVPGAGYMHDFIEVAPGRLIGSGQPSIYLDMTNPLKPKALAHINPAFHRLGYHGAAWPNKARDPLLLMGAEVEPQGQGNAGGDCADDSVHAVATYDTREVVKVDRKQFGSKKARGNPKALERQRGLAAFHKLNEWQVDGAGVYTEGKAPGHTLYCGHWFDPHPDWRAGGVLAIAHYDWGTRFLDVARNGSMKEIGWFQPVAGYTGSAKWITDEVVYVHDYRRGLDILRFTGST